MDCKGKMKGSIGQTLSIYVLKPIKDLSDVLVSRNLYQTVSNLYAKWGIGGSFGHMIRTYLLHYQLYLLRPF